MNKTDLALIINSVIVYISIIYAILNRLFNAIIFFSFVFTSFTLVVVYLTGEEKNVIK